MTLTFSLQKSKVSPKGLPPFYFYQENKRKMEFRIPENRAVFVFVICNPSEPEEVALRILSFSPYGYSGYSTAKLAV